MRVAIPVVGPSYQSRETPLSAQITKNLYPSIDAEAKSIVSLHGFPGLKPWATTQPAPDRGMHVANGVLYKVTGSTLYSINSSGTATARGTITGTGRCDFSNNAVYLVITTGGIAYAFNFAAGTVIGISDADLTLPTTVGYLNNFFIYDQNAGTAGQFVTSQVSDPTDINALNYAEAESHPDDILRIVIYNQLVYFFGAETTEPWYNSGVGNPPFDRVQGGVKPYGLASPWAVSVNDESVFFLDNNRQPQQMVGLEIKPIGNNALGKEWLNYSTVDDAETLSYIIDQQTFFQVNFPTADKSWCYHQPSNSWFQMSYGVEGGRYRGSSYAFAYGKHLMADYENGRVYELDFETHTDNGEVIQRQRATATIHGGLYGVPGATLFFERVEFDVQVGMGLTTGQGSNPLLMVRFSDDGGKTWSGQESYELGAGGDYLRKVTLHQQGYSVFRIYELTFTDPVPFAIFSAWADIAISNGPS
jgi:hypothetical protein